MSQESFTTFYNDEVKRRPVKVLGLHGEWYYGQAINVIEADGPGVVIFLSWVSAEQLPDKEMTETLVASPTKE